MEQKGLWPEESLGEEDLLSIPENAPLALRMAPSNLDEFFGQAGLLAPGKPLRSAIEADNIPSMLLWGPPGTGKTTLARLVALKTKSYFRVLSAVASGVADVRKTVVFAEDKRRRGKKTILFLDEIHRFNKTQQDALLPHVEKGVLTLVGATTENPYYNVNGALLSRMRIFSFEALSENDLRCIIRRAVEDEEKGLASQGFSGKGRRVFLEPSAEKYILSYAKGDARAALNLLEMLFWVSKDGNFGGGSLTLTLKKAQEIAQNPRLFYDKVGDMHYDIVSAYIKSMRGSDPDAAIYWLARMLEGGEDPRFIARRLMICAAEDVGNRDPVALLLAAAASQAASFLGMPEVRIPLAQATIYVASAPKSNSALRAIDEAIKDVKEGPAYPVPLHLKGLGYINPHDFSDHHCEQEYLPKDLLGRKYCCPLPGENKE